MCISRWRWTRSKQRRSSSEEDRPRPALEDEVVVGVVGRDLEVLLSTSQTVNSWLMWKWEDGHMSGWEDAGFTLGGELCGVVGGFFSAFSFALPFSFAQMSESAPDSNSIVSSPSPSNLPLIMSCLAFSCSRVNCIHFSVQSPILAGSRVRMTTDHFQLSQLADASCSRISSTS